MTFTNELFPQKSIPHDLISQKNTALTTSTLIQLKKRIGEFFDKCDDVTFSGMVMKQVLYDKYCEWADANNAPRPPRNTFGEVVVNHDDNEIETDRRRVNGHREYVYTGVHIEA